MGFLSGLGRTLGRIGQNVPMAQAALAGDYGGMASMRAQQERQRLAQAEAEREQAQRASLFNNLVKQGMNPGQAELVMSNPEAFGTEYNTRFRTREGGAGGGTINTPNLNGTVDSRMLGSRHEYQGSVFDVNGTGQTQVHRQGMQAVPLTQGGEVAIMNSWTGQEVGPGGGQAPPPNSGPARVSTAEDYDRLPPGAQYIDPDGILRTKGGAAPATGPGNFRR